MPARLVIAAVWLVCLGAMAIAPAWPAAIFGRLLVLVMLAAHALACLVYRVRLRQASGGLAVNVAHTMVFGIVHVWSLRDRKDG